MTLPQLLSLASPYVGIVSSHVRLLRTPDEPALITVGCTLADATDVVGQELDEHSGGAHTTYEGALGAALGEAAERYSGAFVPAARLVSATARELGRDAVDPARFALFHDRQYAAPGFPFERFTRETRLRWIEGRSLGDGEGAWLPAQLVHLTRPLEGEPCIGYSTSNGLACGGTEQDALVGGLCELIERDAFMIAWSNRLSLPLLDVSRHPVLCELDRRLFRTTGLSYSAVDLSVFLGIPAVLGIVHGPPGEAGALGVGGGCAPSLEDAWRKALAEAFSVRRWARDLALEGRARPEAPEQIASFEDHIAFYLDHDRAEHAAFLDASPDRRDAREIEPVPPEEIAERLGDRGLKSYWVDVTAPDVAEAGLTVARVVVPELCALDVFHTARYLGGERLYRAAFDAGIASRPLEFEDVNPFPHPYP